ncbi:MAG: PilZ domain-containing protein [Spirochaetales bacterium]|nr:PilZ domain-containing protein [Spirochaetales bacterium]
MEERRKLERFLLRLPAKVVSPSAEEEPCRVETRDVSADGAFLVTKLPLEAGASVTVELELPVDRFKQLLEQGRDVTLRINGVVVRSETDGVAVRFQKKYEIVPVESPPR